MPVAMILFPSFYHFTIPFYREIFLLSFFLYSQISFLWSGGDLRQFLVFAASAAKRVGAGWIGQAGGTWWGSKCYSQVEIHCSKGRHQ